MKQSSNNGNLYIYIYIYVFFYMKVDSMNVVAIRLIIFRMMYLVATRMDADPRRLRKPKCFHVTPLHKETIS